MATADGYVTIGFRGDTKELEKDKARVEKELREYDKRIEKLTDEKISIELDNEKYEKTARELEMLNKDIEKHKELLQTYPVTKGWDPKYFKALSLYEDELAKQKELTAQVKGESDVREKNLRNIDRLNTKIEEAKTKQGTVKNRLDDIRNTIEKINGETQRADIKGINLKMDGIKDNISGISRGLTNVVNKAIRWGLAIFSIRSAYSFVRQSLSTVSQYNDQLKADIDYIKFALATTLEPIIIEIVNLVYTLLGYIAYIAKAWFNVDIFAGATMDKFKKMNGHLKGMDKSAKELQKDLYGWDEITKVTEQGLAGGVSGGAGFTPPSVNLQDWQGEIPEWLRWIAEHKDDVIKALTEMAGLLLTVGVAAKLMEFGVPATGIVGFIGMVWSLVAALTKLDEWYDKIKTNNDELGGSFAILGQAVSAFGLVFVSASLLVAAFMGTLAAIPVALAGLWVVIVGWFVGFADEVDHSITAIMTSIETFRVFLNRHTGLFGDFIGTFMEEIASIILGPINAVFQAISGTVATIALLLKGQWKEALLTGLKTLVNFAIIMPINTLIKALNLMIAPIRALIVGIAKIGGSSIDMQVVKIPTIPKLAKGGIINMPGKGVPLAGARAIGGEQAPEGVIPLTDSQQMAILGEAIGRYITVNASITNSMNGRVISRELQRLNTESDFAYNRW